MVKKAKTKLKIKKTCKKLEAQNQRKSKMFLYKLQEILKKSCGKSYNSNESDCFIQEALLYTRNARQSSSRRNPTFPHTNIREDITRDNYTCYRCKHFLEIPHNLSSQPFTDRVPTFVEQCKDKLNFIQAIVWLKSSISCVSQIPVKQLQRIFDKQWNTCDEYNHCKDEHTNIKQLRSSVDLSSTKNIITSTPLNTCDVSCITSQRITCNLYARCEDPRSKPLNSMSANDSVESLILGSSSCCYIAAREKKKDVRSYIIPETDTESILNDDTFYDIPEYQQSFEHEKGTECSMQTASKNGIQQKNKKIIEDKHIFQKSYIVDVPSECKYILPTRNQSTDLMFKSNGESDESFTSLRSQNDLVNKVVYVTNKLEFGSPKNFVITPKEVSQMSNVWNEYFEFLLDSNSPCRASNISTRNSRMQDSAYSTSRINIFNCNIAVEAGSITSKKRMSDTEHDYKLQSCKKKTITYEKEKVSSINAMLTSDGSSRSFIITENDISQISNIYNCKNCEFQETRSVFNSDNEQVSDTSSKNAEVAVATGSILNKCTKNIKYCYELQSCNKKTVTRQKVASPSITQRAVIPHTNIKHCYNLKASNNRKISREKEVRIQRLMERKSERAKNLSEEENENEDEIISANWLNFVVESLHIERVILTSIKMILSTLCDKKMVEVYMMRQQRRNTRNYWKNSLEEEAIKAILNISDIFTIEEKPNICIKLIMIKIVKTLNEVMMQHGQLYKIYCIQTSMWIYRVQMILEFCNSLPICIKVTDYLIMKLKSLQSLLTNVRKLQKNSILIKQLHLVFYALNITLRKYRIIIPSNQRSRSVEKVIPHVADLWKVCYIDKELKYAGLDLDNAEKQWLNVLENIAEIFMNFGFVKFAKESFSLVHVLILQSSKKIT